MKATAISATWRTNAKPVKFTPVTRSSTTITAQIEFKVKPPAGTPSKQRIKLAMMPFVELLVRYISGLVVGRTVYLRDVAASHKKRVSRAQRRRKAWTRKERRGW